MIGRVTSRPVGLRVVHPAEERACPCPVRPAQNRPAQTAQPRPLDPDGSGPRVPLPGSQGSGHAVASLDQKSPKRWLDVVLLEVGIGA